MQPERTLGPLDRATLGQLKALKKELAAEVQGLPQLETRKKRLRMEQGVRLPSIKKRAEAGSTKGVRLGDVYSFAYRFDSNVATHPGIMALEQFLDDDGECVVLRSSPDGSFPDPYVVGGRLFLELAIVVIEIVDPGGVALAIDALRSRIDALEG